MKTEIQKITAQLPAKLLADAQAATGMGITETLRTGLELVARRQACADLLALRGKVNLDIDLDASRSDKPSSWK